MRKIVDKHTFLWYYVQAFDRGGIAQLARAPALQAGGHGFESHHLHQKGLGKRRGERPGKKRAHSSAG